VGHVGVHGTGEGRDQCGGYSIFPSEVEFHLVKHPDIDTAVVVGLPDEIKGQLPAAVVITRPGSDISEDDLMAWAKDHIAAYKCPRRFIITDQVPMTYSFKPKRAELRKMYTDLFKEE